MTNKEMHTIIDDIQKSDWSEKVINEGIEKAKALGADTEFVDALRNLRPWCK